jgi:NitT/TauT family transport system substrate-binding protein
MYVLKDSGVNAKLVSVGGLSASRTQAMSGQLDTGFTVPPVNLDMEAKGQIRIIADADIDAPGLRNLSIRFTAANADWFAKNRDVARRFVKALWKGVLFNHTGGETAIRRYAEKWKIDPALARRAPDFLHAESQSPGQLGDLELLEQLALEFKMIGAPLTPEQRRNLIDIVYDPLKE